MLKQLLKRDRTSPEELRARKFLEEYKALSERLEQIRRNFDFVSEDPEIDALIYEENAVLCLLSAMYSRAREMGLHAEFPDKPPK